jgi:hypothetical protein
MRKVYVVTIGQPEVNLKIVGVYSSHKAANRYCSWYMARHPVIIGGVGITIYKLKK